jgi:hypothetical protein
VGKRFAAWFGGYFIDNKALTGADNSIDPDQGLREMNSKQLIDKRLSPLDRLWGPWANERRMAIRSDFFFGSNGLVIKSWRLR